MSKGNGGRSSTKVAGTTVAAKVGRAPTLEARRPTEAEVALRAYEIYEREGRPVGRHLEHWRCAQAELGLV